MTSSQKALALLGPLRTHKVGLMIFIDQTDVKVLLKMLQICYNYPKGSHGMRQPPKSGQRVGEYLDI